jgi:hypothetical protein
MLCRTKACMKQANIIICKIREYIRCLRPMQLCYFEEVMKKNNRYLPFHNRLLLLRNKCQNNGQKIITDNQFPILNSMQPLDTCVKQIAYIHIGDLLNIGNLLHKGVKRCHLLSFDYCDCLQRPKVLDREKRR